jgi:co-chaperonin GroES (HSP10)
MKVKGVTLLPARSSGTRTMRRLNPLGFRVVVQIRKDANQTEAGLFLPEGAKESMDEAVLGEVVEVASAVDEETSEEANVSGIPLGAMVLVPKRAGIKVPWDDALRIIETKEILAMVYETAVS